MATRQHEARIQIDLPQDRVWELVAQTGRINEQLFEMSPASVIALDRTRARVANSFGRFASEYEEYPWTFAAPDAYSSVRVFTRGYLKKLTTTCELFPAGSATEVRLRFEIVDDDSFVGRIVGALFTRGAGKNAAILEQFLRSAAHNGGVASWPIANPDRDAVLARARGIAAQLSGLDSVSSAILDKLLAHVAEGPEGEVARMRPFALAHSWGTPRRATLEMFLRAASAGLLRLSWDLLCPSCGGGAALTSLRDLPKGGHCPMCEIDFGTDFDRNVEASFSPEPLIRRCERVTFCLGSPAATPSWIAQFVVAPGARHDLRAHLGIGRYRLQAAGVQSPVLLDVREGGFSEWTARLEPDGEATTTRWAEGAPTLGGGDVHLVVENLSSQPQRVQLAHRAFASNAATAVDVTALGLFRELFGREALAPDQQVAVGQMSILFTDLVGSTAMYERIGDAAAYGLVREHFRLLFEAIERFRGRIVKTVGDCVMASFDVPRDAADAGLACIEALRTLKDRDGNPPGLQLKVGVHTGPCIAVNANGATDYFGRTVNVAARVESLARPDELVVSWAIRESPDVGDAFFEALARTGHVVVRDRARVKGVEHDVEVTRIGIATRGGGA